MQPLARITRQEKISPTAIDRIKISLIRNIPLDAIKKNNVDDESMLFYRLTKRVDIIPILPNNHKKQIITNDMGM
jgi:hypothetical protein